MTSKYRIYVDHGLTDANRDRPGLRLALAACRAGGPAKISLPVSALKQDDDALGLINFFATGNRPRPNANYRRSPSAMRTRQVQNALDMLAEPSLQLVSLSAGSGSGKYDSMWLNQDKPVPVAKDMSRSSPEAGCKFSPTARSGTGWCGVSYLKCPFVKRTAQARPDAGGGNRFSPPVPGGGASLGALHPSW